MSTFIQICQDVNSQAGISGTGPSSITNQTGINSAIVRWVAESYNEIQSLHENWKFLFTEVQFTLQETFQEYDITDEEVRVYSKDGFMRQFQLGDWVRMQFIDYPFYRVSEYQLSTRTGPPEIVTEMPDGRLRFFPIPDEDYEIAFEGFHRPYTMDAGLDEPVFHAQYHDLIKLKALMKYGEYYNSSEVYKSADTNFRILLKQMEFSELPKNNFRIRPFA